MTKQPITVTLAYEGKFTDYLSGEIIEASSGTGYEFAAWEYQILIVE
jgi:hypothetical protein